MRQKIIHSSTTVPNELYVERQADRQIERIVQAMGRPGYVLVARQMGKTNLLMRAIRELQRAEDAFVYVDLSNSEATLRDCFRSIIDVAIVTHHEKFSVAERRITDRRINSINTAPHKEHEGELRELLSAITGKLVIVIDEIDALTRTSYSDDLFAKIRSLYMMKEVMPQLKRLTYLLSGVAEPSDLIKNKALSPFNIGEKIYLDGFNENEFKSFLSKAKLDLGQDSEKHLYLATNGNPRMLMDICSELEDIDIAGNSISPSVIDAVINRLYLSSFDRPPVDHIRTLLANDPSLHSSITVIRYGKGNSLSDDIKRRLYLYGIIGSYDGGRNVEFSSPIIAASISQEWLDSLVVCSIDQVSIATQEYDNANYSTALRLAIEAYASESDDIPAHIRCSYLDLISQCYLSLGEYESAIQVIDDNISFFEDYDAVVGMLTAVKAQVTWYQGRRADSIHTFEKALSLPGTIETNLFIMVEYSFLVQPWWLASNRVIFLEKFFPGIIANIGLMEKRLNSIFGFFAIVNNNSARLLKIKVFILAAIGSQLQDDESGRAVYTKKAMDLASPLEQCFLRWHLLAVEPNESRGKVFTDLCAKLSDIGFHIAERSPSNPFLFDSEAFGNLIAWGVKNSAEHELDVLVGNMDLPARWMTPAHMILDISLRFRTFNDDDIADILFDYATGYAERISIASEDAEQLRQIFTSLSINANPKSGQRYVRVVENYMRYFDRISNAKSITHADVSIFFDYALYLMGDGQGFKVPTLLRRISSLRNNVSPECRGYYIYIDAVELLAYQAENDLQKKILAARRVLSAPPVVPLEVPSQFESIMTDFRTFRELASATIKNSTLQSNISAPSYGRNQVVLVRYLSTGLTQRKKFKHVENDIKSGQCVIELGDH